MLSQTTKDNNTRPVQGAWKRWGLFPLLVLALFLTGTLLACGPERPSPSEEGTIEEVPSEGGVPENSPTDQPEPSRCVANNDGIIEMSEVTFALGVTVNVRRNKPGTTINVDHRGKVGTDGVRVWDFRKTDASHRAQVQTMDPTGKWFLSTFPTATLLVPISMTGVQGTLYQVLQKTNNDLLLQGIASESEEPEKEKVLLPYEHPVPLLRFPLRDGKEWIVTSKAKGSIGGMPIASTDQYQIRIEGRGSVKLPDIQFDNTLRVVVFVKQRFMAGSPRQLYQILFMHECYGEVARIESQENETNPHFTQAALLRFISF